MRTVKWFAAISERGIEGIQFSQEGGPGRIAKFLEQVLSRLIIMKRPSPIFVFLDNSGHHRTSQIMKLTERLDIVLLFNAVRKPEVNLIEHFFEYLKRPLRRKFNLCPFSSISAMLKRAQQFNYSHLECCFSRQFEGFVKEVCGK